LTNLSEEKKQWLDEITTAAKDDIAPSMSDWYDDETHSQIYQLCWDYAIHNREPLYLGIFRNMAGYEGKNYIRKKPRKFRYGGRKGLQDWYERYWRRNNRSIDNIGQYFANGRNNDPDPLGP